MKRGLLLAFAILALAGCGESVEPPRPAAEYYRDGKVVLGSPRLTAGIPGSGELTIEQIKAWLAKEENHEALRFALPLGLTDAVELVYIPADNPLTRAKIELGRQLFFDKRLSGLGTFSCAVCHQPQQQYSAFLVMPEVGRNSAVAFNRLFGKEQFWDGKSSSLERQPIVPIENPFEMNSSPQRTTDNVRRVPGYRLQFKRVFGDVTFENICQAIACFERVLVTQASPWDYHRMLRQFADKPRESLSAEERRLYDELRRGAAEHPMSEAALRGEKLFVSDRTGCVHCHTGPNLTDEAYHNLGVGFDESDPDLGRYKVTGQAKHRGAFKTPTLRNVALTPPYMHNGQFDTLPQVLDFLSAGGHPNDGLDPLMHPLDLTTAEKTDLIAFLKSVTSPLPKVETGRLPP